MVHNGATEYVDMSAPPGFNLVIPVADQIQKGNSDEVFEVLAGCRKGRCYSSDTQGTGKERRVVVA